MCIRKTENRTKSTLSNADIFMPFILIQIILPMILNQFFFAQLTSHVYLFRDKVKLDCSSTHDFVDGSIISTDESVVNDDDETSDDDTLAGSYFFIV